MSGNLTKDRILDAADRLFYQQGYEPTSFAQIASAVGISRGNFYHHFKTKDDILNAVINRRLNNTNSMLTNWEVTGNTPHQRISSFINILMTNSAKIKRHGCPVGTLCSELTKLNHPAKTDANQLFTLFRAWLKQQFEHLGYQSEADALAMHLLAMSQGVALLASAFEDEKFINTEVARLHQWLATYTTTISQSEK